LRTETNLLVIKCSYDLDDDDDDEVRGVADLLAVYIY